MRAELERIHAENTEPEMPAFVSAQLAGIRSAPSYVPRELRGWLDEVIRCHATSFRNN